MPGVLQTSWSGFYFDGQTSRRQLVNIVVMPSGLELSIAGGSKTFWPYHEITQTQGGYQDEPIRLERMMSGQPLPETLVVENHTFLNALTGNVGSPTPFAAPVDRRRQWQRLAFAIIGSLAGIAVLVIWGIPVLAELLTPVIPVSWEVSLGKAMDAQLTSDAGRCTSGTLQTSIDAIVARLAAGSPSHAYQFHVSVVDSPVFNAFAAPGGYIIILRPLLEATKTPEELAGVLAHEMQHVYQRHATKALVRDLSLGLLIGAIFGDVTGVGAFGVQAARTLTTLHYSRETEEQADREGMALIRAVHIDPAGIIAFFTTLKEQAERVNAPAYLSSHPDTDARIAALKRFAEAPSPTAVTPLLEGQSWYEVKSLCR